MRRSIMTLTEILHNWLEAQDAVEDNDGEVTDDLAERLDAYECALTEKVDAVLRYAYHLEADAGCDRERVKALEARARADENKAQRLRDYVLVSLQMAGLTKLRTPDYSVSTRVGNTVVEVTDEAAIPDTFIVVKRSPDKRALLAALKDGRT